MTALRGLELGARDRPPHVRARSRETLAYGLSCQRRWNASTKAALASVPPLDGRFVFTLGDRQGVPELTLRAVVVRFDEPREPALLGEKQACLPRAGRRQRHCARDQLGRVGVPEAERQRKRVGGDCERLG